MYSRTLDREVNRSEDWLLWDCTSIRLHSFLACDCALGSYLDILAVSCDSFNAETNELIGRQRGSRDHLESLMKVRQWCTQYKV